MGKYIQSKAYWTPRKRLQLRLVVRKDSPFLRQINSFVLVRSSKNWLINNNLEDNSMLDFIY